jgi:ribonuclease HI
MRVLAINTFVFSFVSYSNCMFLMAPERLNRLSSDALRFVTPVPFCSFNVLSHGATLFKVDRAPRDPLLDNVASVLSTAYMLQRRGVISEGMLNSVQEEINSLCADDMVTPNNLIGTPRPLLHFVVAANLFRQIAGTAPDAFLQSLSPSQLRGGELHRRFYNSMMANAAKRTQTQLEERIVSAGLAWEPLRDNLIAIPSSTPRAHRITFFKFILNGLTTSVRIRFNSDVTIRDCPFCSLTGGDDRRHWVECPALRRVFLALYPDDVDLNVTQQAFHMQVPLTGRGIQLQLAVIHAIWRCRCILVRGYTFNDFNDLVRHFHSLVEDPWLQGSPIVLGRVERRALRAETPDLPGDTYIYFFDGACRRGNQTRSASFGALLRYNGRVIARVAVYLHDMSNNEAEYHGAIAVLQHAVSRQYSRVLVYGDSKLVVKQLCGMWKCKAENLSPYYEDGLDLMRQLRQNCAPGAFGLSHVYREFNADADSLANIAIDSYRRATVTLVDEAWYGGRNPYVNLSS